MSFINPLFLFAASAALLPIIYHLIRKSRAKQIRFSSLLFLRATPKQVIKKRRLRDLLLLIIRCAILGLLALVFARPFIPREAVPFMAQPTEKSTVILIDASYSMQLAGLFEEARKLALDRVNQASDGDEISIVLFSDIAEQLSQLGTEKSNHRMVINNTTEASNRSTDFYKPLRLSEQILGEAKHKNREIVLISDLQSNGWSDQFDNWNIDPSINFVPIKVEREIAGNAYIEKSDLKVIRTGEKAVARLGVQVAASPGSEAKIEEIALWTNDVKVETEKGQDSYPFQTFFQQHSLREGDYQGYVALSQDDLPVDNYRYFSFAVEKRPRILSIDGSGGSSRSNQFYLSKCFDMADRSLFEFSAGRKSHLSLGRLKQYDLVFLTNERSLTNGQIEQLKRYIEGGGNLIISFGGRVNTGSFSQVLLELGIGQIREKVWVRSVQASNAIIGEVDLRHPIFAAFGQSGGGDILKPRFSQYLRIDPDSNATVIGRYDTEDPFLIERSIGKGKIIVLTSTFNTEWGDFPVNEIFLPFVYQLAKYVVTSTQRRTDYLVGETVQLEGQVGDEWEIQAPGDKLYKVSVDESGVAYFRNTDSPGNYQAALGNDQHKFSVNLDIRESDLAGRDPEETYAAVAGASQNMEERNLQAKSSDINEDEKRQKLWKYLLFAILGLFLLETVVANRKLSIGSSQA